jgi:hypothetical protein
LSENLVHGDALTMLMHDGQPITFAEWGYLGKGKFQRRDFRFDALTQRSSFSQEGALFAHLGKHEVFTPLKAYPPMTARELAGNVQNAASIDLSHVRAVVGNEGAFRPRISEENDSTNRLGKSLDCRSSN